MPAGNVADRRDFDIPASQAAQDHFNAVAGHLESLINQSSLSSNDETAGHALQRAKTAVVGIG